MGCVAHEVSTHIVVSIFKCHPQLLRGIFIEGRRILLYLCITVQLV
jgi:hypothetical protein